MSYSDIDLNLKKSDLAQLKRIAKKEKITVNQLITDILWQVVLDKEKEKFDKLMQAQTSLALDYRKLSSNYCNKIAGLGAAEVKCEGAEVPNYGYTPNKTIWQWITNKFNWLVGIES